MTKSMTLDYLLQNNSMAKTTSLLAVDFKLQSNQVRHPYSIIPGFRLVGLSHVALALHP
jgi:hypothetical protein